MNDPLLEERLPVRIFVTVPGVGMATAYSTLLQLVGETTDGDRHGLGDYTIRISWMNGRILIAMEDDGWHLAIIRNGLDGRSARRITLAHRGECRRQVARRSTS